MAETTHKNNNKTEKEREIRNYNDCSKRLRFPSIDILCLKKISSLYSKD